MLDIQKYIGKPKIVVSNIDDKTTVFEVQYLPRGFGHTLGNAIRRLVLGYNVAGSITALKVKGVSHEYQVIDGIKESVIDIMLNFKKLRFKLDENIDKLQWLTQRFKGIGQYSAKDLKLNSGIEGLTDDSYLFEITDPNLELIIDFRLEKGYGYYTMDFLRKREEKSEDTDTNLLLIDNDFKAVDYVKYEVDNIIDDFSGGSKDNLIIEVKSIAPVIKPQELLCFAGEILSSYAKLFIFDSTYIDKSVLTEYEDIEDSAEKMQEELNIKTIPIDALPLSERTRNALIKNEILYVEDLETKRKAELLSMKGVGRKAVDEIVVSLDNMGRALAG